MLILQRLCAHFRANTKRKNQFTAFETYSHSGYRYCPTVYSERFSLIHWMVEESRVKLWSARYDWTAYTEEKIGECFGIF
jgi:hypothetical protein